MQSTQITLRNMRGSPALTRRIQEKSDRLSRFHPHILRCRVSVERSGAHGRTRPFLVTLRIAVPGAEIVVAHAHEIDAHLAVRDAFATARRRLKEESSVKRGEVKEHSKPHPENRNES
jgi:ribosome-associated translation inhibitor RaiA